LKRLKTKNLYIIIPVIAMTLIVLTLTSYYTKINGEEVDTAYKDKLLRFHVIANSDSPEDQVLKEKVKNEVLNSLQSEMAKLKNIENVKEYLKDKSDFIEEIARGKLKENGKDYDVKAYLDTTFFPIKNYGPITLPGGEYQSLRIELGDAGGSNWWCILFPPLCFVDITQGLTPEKTIKDLEKVLTDREISELKTAKNQTDIPVEIRFKLVEIFNEIGDKFASAMDRLDFRN